MMMGGKVLVLLVATVSAGMYGKNSGVKTLTDSVFPGKDSDKTWFVEFYAPWCGHCKALTPKWTQMAQALEKEGSEVKVGAVDCTANQQVCQKHGVQGYPTIKLIKQGKPIDYQGPREVSDMMAFAKSGGRGSGGGGGGGGGAPGGAGGAFYGKSSGVKTLTNSVFPGKDSNKVWFVEFYAPWCGHCKNLKPKWSSLAQTLSNEGSDVKVGAVDCTQNQQICQQHGVKGYPTLKLINKGKPVDYNGPRETADLVKFARQYSDKKASGTGGEATPEAGGDGGAKAAKKKCGGDYSLKSGVNNLCEGFFPGAKSKYTWIVEFYAPWCGHCKALKPKWTAAGKALIDDPNIRVGAVDCTQNQSLCQRYGVKGYPTIKVIKKGAPTDYNGPRETQDIVNFVKKQA